MVIFLRLPGKNAQPPELRLRRQFPADHTVAVRFVVVNQVPRRVLFVKLRPHLQVERLERYSRGRDLRFVAEIGLGVERPRWVGDQLDDPRIAQLALQPAEELLKLIQSHQVLAQFSALQLALGLALAVLHGHVLRGAPQNLTDVFFVVLDVFLALALLDAIERRLRNVDMPAQNEFGHVPVEEREQQRPDMRSVHIGVGHQDDLVIAQFADVEIVLPDARAQCRDQDPDFLVPQHLVIARFLDVQDLAAQR